MSHATRPPHRIVTATVLILTGVLLAFVVTQCRQVPDNLLGIKLSASSARAAGDCIAACAKAYNDSIRVESDFHVATVKACAGDSTCLAHEETRHVQAVRRIQDGRRACQNNCHHQGGGQGGR